MKVVPKIEMVAFEKIRPYERNPRKNDEAVPFVVESIRRFGFNVPLVIDENNVIVCGHTRWKAAKQLALTTLPCIRADDLTPAQVKAFRLVDNKVGESSKWSSVLLGVEIDEISQVDLDSLGFENITGGDGDDDDSGEGGSSDGEGGKEGKKVWGSFDLVMSSAEELKTLKSFLRWLSNVVDGDTDNVCLLEWARKCLKEGV